MAERPELPHLIDVVVSMSNTEKKATEGMIKFVLTTLVVAVIIAVAYLALFTPGQV
ncbi:hypothetical protein HFO98_33950 [Rhizobium leguminosarum]|uniref:hypothetical protein n=1 Tax=Rhizobium leguminosarum TaxID=384 RepID=UPI001C97C20B|nr:hypothetical protein [Rhizobium leguminosarum]MBY5413332.1 hypothetical protein [Rhizobium leguminosarum]